MKIYFFLIFISISCPGKKAENRDPITFEDSESSSNSIELSNEVTEHNRIYYVDEFNNVNFLNKGINKFEPAWDKLEIVDGKFKISYFINKGEKVVMRGGEKYLKITTTDSIRNKELNFPTEFFKRFDEKDLDRWTFQLSKTDKKYSAQPELREKEFKQLSIEYNAFLREYCNTGCSNDFLLFYEQYFHYKILVRKLFLFGNNVNFPKQYLDSVIQETTPYFNNDQLLFCENFRKALYGHFHTSIKVKENVIEFLKSNYSPLSRAWLAIQLLLDQKGDHVGLKLTENQQADIQNYVYQTYPSTHLLDYYKKSISLEGSSFDKDQLVDVSGNVIDFKSTLGEKITYIDFWASWCGPCRAEMPPSKILKEEFKNNKDIKFLYISIDNNPAAWEKAMKQIGLLPLESYLLPDYNNSELVKQQKITSIPRYMIMDKSGNILVKDAPRPSDPGIKEILNGFLEE